MIENELKYVLSLEAYAKFVKSSFDRSRIIQVYDSRGARFRNQNGFYTFNYKLVQNDVVEEFEMEISKEEFERCYSVCSNRLEKERYTIKDLYGNTWDIDFFFDNGSLYFAMAECEMVDAYATKPEEILHLVRQHIIYEVPKNRYFDFTSSKLSDVLYAKNQLTFLQNSI